MSAKVVTMDGHAVHDNRSRNRYAVREAIRIARMIRSGEVVGFSGALQYADGGTQVVSAGFQRTFQIVGALEVAKAQAVMATLVGAEEE